MKIAIDTQTILGQKSGFGFYVKNLVENLKKVDPENEYVLIAPDADQDFSTPQRFFWDQFYFPKKARLNKVDILHQPCFSAPTCPLFYRGKIIVTIHDIISLKFPENLPLASRLFYSKWMPYSYRKADMIIVDSEHTKKDIMEYLKIPAKKIRVMYWAVSKDFRPITDKKQIEEIKLKYKTGEKYFIHIGTLEPRKNLPFLVRAFAYAVKDGLKENLVITGKKGWYYDDLFTLVNDLQLTDRVIFTGYAEDKDIPSLYSGATALTFPSLYEGFGFPPLEAMACGTPVISSNTSSLPEVVGNAGILLPPHGTRAWSNAMMKLSLNESLRQELKTKGLAQVTKFSWEETAKRTVEVYKEVFNGK